MNIISVVLSRLKVLPGISLPSKLSKLCHPWQRALVLDVGEVDILGVIFTFLGFVLELFGWVV